MPLDVLSTNFKLAAFKDGWQVRIGRNHTCLCPVCWNLSRRKLGPFSYAFAPTAAQQQVLLSACPLSVVPWLCVHSQYVVHASRVPSPTMLYACPSLTQNHGFFALPQYVVHDSRVSSPETSENQPKLHVTVCEPLQTVKCRCYSSAHPKFTQCNIRYDVNILVIAAHVALVLLVGCIEKPLCKKIPTHFGHSLCDHRSLVSACRHTYPHTCLCTMLMSHMQIIEFDTIAHIIGHLGIRMSMVAYPLITIHKVSTWKASASQAHIQRFCCLAL